MERAATGQEQTGGSLRGASLWQPLSRLAWAIGLCTLSWPGVAFGQQAGDDEEEAEDPTGGRNFDPLLSLDPSNFAADPLPGGTVPATSPSTSPGDWRFGFHGMFTMPMVLGFNTREDPEDGQSKTVIHAPPVIPGDRETFSYTGVTPTPYVQLNFSYGNSIVTANVQVLAHQASVSSGFFDPASQRGINDAYFTVTPNMKSDKVSLKMHFGAFSNRYGMAGEFDQGRYATPLIFRTNGVGGNTIAKLRVAKHVVLGLEHGIQSQSNAAPPDLVPDLWNGFADPNAGSSIVNHVHAGAHIAETATIGLHYGSAFSRDDRATGTLTPDGKIGLMGADLRLTMGRFGHLYAAASRVDAEYAGTVSSIVEVLNTPGGAGLIENYLGDQSEGNGALTIFGGQYDLSVGRLVSYPVPFYGDGPDIVVSLFGMSVGVESDDDRADGVQKLKFGGEASYSLLSWFAASARFDQVMPNMNESRYSYIAVSPRLIFRTDWQSNDQLSLQYTRFIHGSLTTARTGAPPRVDPFVKPDDDVVSLSASMWW